MGNSLRVVRAFAATVESLPGVRAPATCAVSDRSVRSGSMRLLDRYLLRESLIPLGYCLSGFFVFWMAFDLLSQLDALQSHQLTVLEVAQYYAMKTPELLVTVLPLALLLALLYALTHHARHNELTAMRAAGVSLWRLSAPYLGVGLGFSLVVFGLNELWVPDSAARAEDILDRALRGTTNAPSREWERNLTFRNDRDGRRWDIGAYHVESGAMVRPHVEWRLPDGSARELFAERAWPTNGGWVFHQVQKFVTPAGPDAIPQRTQTNEVRLDFWETPALIASEIKINRLDARTASKRAALSLAEILQYRRLHPEVPAARRALVETQFHARLAMPWTCLVVVLIAIPFGAASGRRNVFVGVASSVGICFTFFVLQQVALALGTGQYLPPWLAGWGPNLIFAGAGVWLTGRIR